MYIEHEQTSQTNLSLTKTMSIHKQWSVASVFNRWGVYRSEDGIKCPLMHISMEDMMRQRLLIGSSAQHEQVKKNCNEVAECIRKLGYIVTCGDHAPLYPDHIGNNYIIMSIQELPMNVSHHLSPLHLCTLHGHYIYGDLPPPPPHHAYSSRNLVGHRTIYDKATRFCPEIFNFTAHDEAGIYWDQSNVMTQHKIEGLIDTGACCNQLTTNNSPTHRQYSEGISTIGNTLPNDIVYALQEFTSDDVNFRKEPDYEFYIPPSMLELHACPAAEVAIVADESENNTGAVAAADVELPGIQLEFDAGDSDSSSDDEE